MEKIYKHPCYFEKYTYTPVISRNIHTPLLLGENIHTPLLFQENIQTPLFFQENIYTPLLFRENIHITLLFQENIHTVYTTVISRKYTYNPVITWQRPKMPVEASRKKYQILPLDPAGNRVELNI